MMQIRRLSVRATLIGTFSLLIALIVMFQIWYFPRRYYELAADSLRVKARSVTSLAAHDVSAGFEFGDAKSVSATFDGAKQDPDLEFMVLLKPDGSRFAALNPERVPSFDSPPQVTAIQERHEEDRITLLVPVRTSEGIKGVLAAGFSTVRIAQERRGNQVAVTLIGLGILAAGLAVTFAISNSVGRRLSALGASSRKVAEGNLDVSVPETDGDDEIGRMARDLDSMIRNLRSLAGEIQSISLQINSASAEVFTTARQQELSASQQASAIEQTRRTMDSLLDSSRAIAQSAEGVLQNAELTLRNNRLIAERNEQLFAHIHRITEILEVIKDIANKSDLLALNASLEGTKAGEAGRGFSLVAAQMQRLAENVMGSVQDIKRLVTDVREASHAAVLATEEGTKLADQTTQSARQIRLITQQQQTGTEQVSHSMDDASQQLSHGLAGIRETTEAMKNLAELSEQLSGRVKAFRLQ